MSDSAIPFQDGVTNLLIQTEELRRNLNTIAVPTNEDCFRVLHDVDELMRRLYSSPLAIDISNTHVSEIEVEMRNHCVQKTTNVAMQALKIIVTKKEPDPDDVDYLADEEKECQSATARLAELNLVLCCDDDKQGNKETTKKKVDEIIEVYSSYQKLVLRQRAKPSIARLVDYRKNKVQMEGIIANSNEDDEGMQSTQNLHIQSLTTILGQATALIHPLMMWRSNLPPKSALFEMCSRSIKILDDQAQMLTQTVAGWFMEDSKIDTYWMVQMASSENNHEDHSSANRTTNVDLGDLDSVVDRLAFSCQMFDRYIELVVKENESHFQNPTTVIQEILPEWTWKYASLERFLTTKQLISALQPNNNVPVEIIVGASVQVPSMVEDAQYLSTRALKRAASTRSDQAIGTVAHSIASDVWTTDTGGHGIYEALVEQKGCYNPRSEELSSTATGNRNSNTNRPVESPPRSNNNSSSFARALLDALDEDTQSSSLPAKAPNSGSGGLLGTFSSSLASTVSSGERFLQIRLNTHLCALNGMQSASVSCSSLVDFLDSLLTSDDEGGNEAGSQQEMTKNSMVFLAREELSRYSKKYQDLLESQVVGLLSEFGGNLQDAPVYRGTTLVPILRYYLERESFDLTDAKQLSEAEDDVRLHKVLIEPIKNCKLLQQFEKCDAGVLRTLCREIAHVLAELFLDVIMSTTIPKRFTDWGSLLFSKEVRLVQDFLQALMDRAISVAAASHQDLAGVVPVLTSDWERLSQAVTILQLEKPSDWSMYYQSTSVFSPEELKSILSLRLDFQKDTIERVVSSAIESSKKNEDSSEIAC